MLLKNKILISGWYGFGNLGDEVILTAIASRLSSNIPNAAITCLSFNPEFTKRYQGINAVWQLPAGLRAWIKSLLTLRLFATLKALLNCDLLILGGGGFLSDWQPEAPWIWLRQALIAKLFGKRVMLYGIGAGPFLSKKGKRITSFIINHCICAVTVRDESSFNQLIQCGVRTSLIKITADPAIAFPIQSIKKEAIVPPLRVGFCIAPIFHSDIFWPGMRDKYDRYINELRAAISILTAQGFKISFIPMQQDADISALTDIQQDLDLKIDVLPSSGNMQQDVSSLSKVDILVAMRLHAAILGSLQGVPVVGIIYHHKVHDFLERIGLKRFASELGDGNNWRVSDIEKNQLVASVNEIARNYPQIQSDLSISIRSLQHQEFENIQTVMNILGGKV